jgi:hypothetical protein
MLLFVLRSPWDRYLDPLYSLIEVLLFCSTLPGRCYHNALSYWAAFQDFKIHLQSHYQSTLCKLCSWKTLFNDPKRSQGTHKVHTQNIFCFLQAICTCIATVQAWIPVEFSLLQIAQTGSEVHPTSYRMGTGGSFPGGKAAGALSWPLTSN